MTLLVSLHHATRYRYDRPVTLGPHEIRLKPAPECRTPISSYALAVRPERHTTRWYRDHGGNAVARVLFPDKVAALEINVEMTVDLAAINPFDFLVDPAAMHLPFRYPDAVRHELAPFLETVDGGELLRDWLADFQRSAGSGPRSTVAFLVQVNERIKRDISYVTRLEHGVQSCDETLRRASGSCRDSGWLLAQILRRLGVAARFVSGYLVQLAGDGPDSSPADRGDLHAWAEAYLPGAGWIGFDPTSGLLASECHIPLARASTPALAAPVTGSVEPCRSQIDYAFSVQRL